MKEQLTKYKAQFKRLFVGGSLHTHNQYRPTRDWAVVLSLAVLLCVLLWVVGAYLSYSSTQESRKESASDMPTQRLSLDRDHLTEVVEVYRTRTEAFIKARQEYGAVSQPEVGIMPVQEVEEDNRKVDESDEVEEGILEVPVEDE